ncbi:thiopeptide-type bacteriocin biosynthesis protein [Streptomyces sp. Mg1]|uniref:thiopeptide-type bacteriocin biosynthesis protein n=1 Tax=Streptomyces sp. Mg1 TaxID=465541 RepID=UPI00017F213D|nr:thiopeptide-type bacteriocin biosynthesis protein [Streptomyces sp. Mg1]
MTLTPEPPTPAEPVPGTDGLTLPQFLRCTADRYSPPHTPADPRLARLGDVFIAAGLAALHRAAAGPSWSEFRLRPVGADRGELYARIVRLGREALDTGEIDAFFFVHKAPGLRLRFRTGPNATAEPDHLAAPSVWQDQGCVASWSAAVYEPEEHLFGGPVSMDSVHRIFTADSLLWAEQHASAVRTGPPWALSLLMTRALFEELGVSGWEDREIWDLLRRRAHRRFAGEPPLSWQRTAESLGRLWADPERLRSLLDPQCLEALGEYRAAVRHACAHWQETYFQRPGARVGPREAAAFLVVHHWNRARLPMERQIAVTEALSGPENLAVL